MKSYRTAGILLLLIAVLTTVYIVAKDKLDKQDEQEPQNAAVELVDIDINNVQKISVSMKQERFVVERTDEGEDTWDLIFPDDIREDKTSVKSLVATGCSISSDKLAAENAEDLSLYGLDDPATVEIFLKDDTIVRYHIGKETIDKGTYYINVAGSNDVYVLNSYDSKRILVNRDNLRDRRLYLFGDSQIVLLEMERDGKLLFMTDIVDEWIWKTIAPIKVNMSYMSMEPILSSIYEMRVNEFIEKNPKDLTVYGLENPKYEFTAITEKGEAVNIRLGNQLTGKNTIYAMKDNEDEVFTVSLSGLNYIDRPLRQLVESYIYLVNIKDIEKIEVEMDGYKVEMDVSSDGENVDNDIFHVNGKEAQMKNDYGVFYARRYYRALAEISFDEIYENDVPQGEAEITITYHIKKEPHTVKLEFIPKDDTFYYAVNNGEYTGVVVRKSIFSKNDGIRDTYRDLMEALNKE